MTHTSLTWDPSFRTEGGDVSASVFYGLGADGTVGANKNSIKIIGQETDLYAQGYFVYDSKKSGAITVSHLRSSPRPIRSAYLVDRASFVACHQFEFVDKIDVLEYAAPGAAFLLNAPFPRRPGLGSPAARDAGADHREARSASSRSTPTTSAKRAGMGRRINTIMQTCFFAISGVLPRDEAIAHIKKSIEKTYGKRGPEVVRRNCEVVDQALAHLHEIPVPAAVSATHRGRRWSPTQAPDFVQKVTRGDAGRQGRSAAGQRVPRGRHVADRRRRNGRNATSRSRSRSGIARSASSATSARWSVRTPRSAPRSTTRARSPTRRRRSSRRSSRATSTRASSSRSRSRRRTAPAATCASTSARPRTAPTRSTRRSTCTRRRRCASRSAPTTTSSWTCPSSIAPTLTKLDHKSSQFLEPLFEYSGACAGCGETPYLKLLTQLFGDRLLIANATGCSSIYGGNLPTTPYTTNRDGRGPAWANSLFEDNAEFGFGFRLALDAHAAPPREPGPASGGAGRRRAGRGAARRGPVERSRHRGAARARRSRCGSSSPASTTPEARRLETLADYLVKKSVWLVGGDGWAYDIGYGGLDHVLANRRDVNILVLDTEVYSNTGGQASKATPLGAAAKFAAAGKPVGKKDLGLLANMYGHVYVAQGRLRRQDGADRAGLPRSRSRTPARR